MKFFLLLLVTSLVFLTYVGIGKVKATSEVYTIPLAQVMPQIVLPRGEKLVNMWGDQDATNMLTVDSVAVYHWRNVNRYNGFSEEVVIKEYWQANNTYGQDTPAKADTVRTTVAK